MQIWLRFPPAFSNTGPMRLVAVSIVKNEADIIEAFVRHTHAWVDRHLVFDHDSTDGTRAILQALRAEGLPLELFTDDALGNLQQARSNHLVRLAAERGADWILPLDADEILTGSGRAALEEELGRSPPLAPRSVFLSDQLATAGDDPRELNPVRRLQHRARGAPHTRKLMIPRALALDPSVQIGKGSHALSRHGAGVADGPLPEAFYLAHFPLRSPEHQALRVVLAELQKLSGGRATAGVDMHYRLGFQLLAENPELFFAVTGSAAGATPRAIRYDGGPLRYSAESAGWNRAVRALLPYLEKLATSHGRLLDQAGIAAADEAPVLRELLPAPATDGVPAADAFTGFTALEGWGPREGPVAAAFLPPFHWSYAPRTRLAVDATTGGEGRFVADLLTYSEAQTVTLSLNDRSLARLPLPRVNQKERWSVALPLQPGRNEITLAYDRHLAAPHDPRQLAAIFLSLRILPPA